MKPANAAKNAPVGALPAWVITPSILWLALFFVIPVIGVFVVSVGTPVGYSGVQLGFDTGSFERIFSGPFIGVFIRTLLLAAFGTAMVFLIAFPTAYWLARYAGRKKYLILAILVIPFWTSFLVRAFAWLIVLSPDWFVSRAIQATGIVETFRPIGTLGAVAMVVIYNYLPLAILPLFATLERMNWSLVEAAEDLGASGRRAFFSVTLPSIRVGIITSILLVFVPMTGEYVIPQIIGSGKQALFANLIGQQFLQAQNWPLGAALAAFLIVTVGVGALLVLTFTQRRDH